MVDDEPRAAAAVGRRTSERCRSAEMPAGVESARFVHRVLEATDFAAADLDAELAARIAEVAGAARGRDRRPGGGGRRAARRDRDAARAAARRRCGCATWRAPTGSTSSTFELPLAGGDEPTGALALDAIARRPARALAAGDPLAGYADRLADRALRRDVRGYLTGSIDLVVRAGDRFAVLDYKTNWLGAPGEALTAWHYRPAALAAEMERAHYGLQALLYRSRCTATCAGGCPATTPSATSPACCYLFLRGMTGARRRPAPCGVFAWRPPGALVEALSDVLERGR